MLNIAKWIDGMFFNQKNDLIGLNQLKAIENLTVKQQKQPKNSRNKDVKISDLIKGR